MFRKTVQQGAKRRIISSLHFLFFAVIFSCGQSPDQTQGVWGTGSSSCGSSRDSFIAEPDNKFFSLGRHIWDAGRIEVTGTYTICGVMVRLNQKNVVAGAPEQNINVRIFDHNARLDQPGRPVGNTSFTMNASTIPEVQTNITFTGLNTPVTPGTYWIVFNSDSRNIDHYIEMQGTNITTRGRALSYSDDEQSIAWTEFYYGRINFVLFGN